MEFYAQLAKALTLGPVVLATVVQTRGSVPREVGAKMFLCSNGHTFDTIGGGAGEAKVIAQAHIVLATGHKQWVDIDLSGAPQREGVCGGQMRVWLERWQGPAAIALTQTILTHLQAGNPITLVTPFAPTATPHFATPETPPAPPHTAFLEPIQPAPLLLIIGAGHVGTALAQVAHLAGFQIIIQDDRPDWANPTRFPQAQQIWTGDLAAHLTPLRSQTQLYVALVTRSYHHDCQALQSLLSQPIAYRYIGMIGSKKRIQTVRQATKNSGIPSERLNSLHAPIGLAIGALTPTEIAISICAELIQTRRQQSN